MSAYLSGFVDINGLPLLACLAVSGILVYLGMHVVERKVIFVDLALAQIAALGIMWAILMGYNHEEDTVAVTLYSLAFTVIGAIVFSITRTRNERVPHEALIGIIYVAASAGGLVMADRFALGTEALNELIAGRVALVTPGIVAKLAITCAVVGAAFGVLHRRFVRISSDPKGAQADGMNIRIWDFVFYVLFGVLITQCVSVLGVLPVFAYLVIPAVAAAFLFESVHGRLIFGWIFAGVISLSGLETARLSQLDPGPTIVCLFAGTLVLLGVALYLRERRFSLRAILNAAGLALLFAGFLAGTLLFRKPQRTNELETAIEFAGSGDATRMRQAIQSFRSYPADEARWLPLVASMLTAADPVARREAIALLGETKAAAAVAPLLSRLAGGAEEDDAAREAVVEALRAIADPLVVPALVEAAAREVEPDIAVEMCEAAFALGGSREEARLRRAVAVLLAVITDDDAPNGARRDAGQLLRRHVAGDLPAGDDALAAWWADRGGTLVWEAAERSFRAP